MMVEYRSRAYLISGIAQPILMTGCDELLPVMNSLLRDWTIEEVPIPVSFSPQIELELTAKGYCRRSYWAKETKYFRDPVDTVCDFIVDLIHAYLDNHENLLCLHCAAVELKDGIVLFPNTYRAGKSTLSVKMASLGCRVFSDDVIPYSPSEDKGVGLGILPRLRLPLPQLEDTDFCDFVTSHSGPSSKRYSYTQLDKDQLAPLGEVAAISGITLLERKEGIQKATIRRADKGDVLKSVIERNFAQKVSAINTLDSLYSMVEKTDCFILCYSSLQQAADALFEQFGSK